ncbi:MAG: GSCFA domain-containing protein [Flavobacteriaceae bacterium]|nr:GSCFA domain-containing protein [Flavobacteriaceae bacterium]
MNFRTQIKLNKTENQIDYKSNLLLIGSCFSNNIGAKFEYYKLNSITNPFGTIFQPKAIEKLIAKSLTNELFTTDDLIFHNETWHCLDVHSDFNSPNKNTVLAKLNSVTKQTKVNILDATHIIITLGTAWVYRFIENDELVANCHKISQKKFKKELLPVKDITISLKNSIRKIKKLNKECSIIFTLSPVRHLKDGFVENQQSKAHLLTAIHKVVASTNANYFPSYEILLDDLRDYRFYKDDMLHPNQTAIDYIWNIFSEVWIKITTKETMQKVTEIQNGLNHRPFNKNSDLHQIFLRSLQIKIDTLKNEFGIKFH